MGLIKPKKGGGGVSHELYTMEITNNGSYTIFTSHCNNSSKATSEQIDQGQTKTITFIRDSYVQIIGMDLVSFGDTVLTISSVDGCDGVLAKDNESIAFVTNNPGKANSKITLA